MTPSPFLGAVIIFNVHLRVSETYYSGLLDTSVLFFRLQLVEIMGKRSRKVPVILTPDMIQGINCLIKYRESVNVNSSNKYIFAAPSTSNSFFKGWDALISVWQQIPDLKTPHLIKTTKLTKYVETVFLVLYWGVVKLHVNMCLKNSVDCIDL